NSSFYDRPIDLVINGKDSFKLSFEINGQVIVGTYQYGQKVVTDYFEFIIEKTPYFDFPKVEGRYFFVVNSPRNLYNYLQSNVKVRPENFNAKTIRISLTDHNQLKARDLVMAIDTLYLEYTKEAKNQAVQQKIDWLNDQIAETEAKVEGFESYFENFIIEKKTTNFQSEIGKTINRLISLDSARFTMRTRIKNLDSVIEQMRTREDVLGVSPLVMSELPEVVATRLKSYQSLLSERRIKADSYSESTMVMKKLNNELSILKDELYTLIDEYREMLGKSYQQLSANKEQLERTFSQMPSTGTEYAKNTRFYSLQEQFLSSLRRLKMEMEITIAGTVANFVVLYPASFPTVPIKPKPMFIYAIGASVGVILSLVFVVLRYLLNNKISSLKELEKLVSVPVLGAVPAYTTQKLPLTKLVINPGSKSGISEALRSIRTNMEFLNGSSETHIMTITSTISGEGKTFVAVNLGAIIAFSKKRVCIVDLDMRKPKVHLAFNDEPRAQGVSTLLIGRNKLSECIV
ncbi:MAG: GNVR domain-containing protein, partial [Marinoscillum sp.]